MEYYNVWLRDLGRKYLENFEMGCCRRMEKRKCLDKVTDEEVLEESRTTEVKAEGRRTLLDDLRRRSTAL